ncbi:MULTISPECIES: N-terminal phage integrase SAM-like domain-containing protein [unclassified Nocardiopsis]|uniref:N-terminal phage integrase SAM-like domain-containing protein n=1 Tax=unclassified Nocardiopsis TaxID=2649073 RepID=UPI001F3B9F8A|nr:MULTISPECIES: N-terminal phage integrase SAM-like domain-containing protein [unclassified Nocardiopsis]
MLGPGSVFKRCGCRVAGTSRRLGSGCPRLRSRRHGSWYFSLESAQTPGGRCRVRRGGFASREAARVALRRARGDEQGAEPVVWTVAAWLRHWLEGRTRLRARTRVSYAEHIDRYLVPHLGEVVLEELTPARVQRAFEGIAEHITPRGRPVAVATVQRVRSTLRAALNTAVRSGCCPPTRPTGCGWRPVRARGPWCGRWSRPALSWTT